MYIDITNLLNISRRHGLTISEIKKEATKLQKFLVSLKSKDQGFYSSIDDPHLVKNIQKFTRQQKNRFRHIVVLGIGGSALGTICLKQSLTHLFASYLENSSYPSLHILDNIDPDLISQLEDIINYRTTLFIVVTKSGGTPEVLAQYFYFRKKYSIQKLNHQKHFVFVTDKEKGLLRKISQQEKITTFDIPTNVGGRFSVLTAVGLLPASLIGININKLIIGAKRARNNFLSTSASRNLAFKLATIQYLLSRKGKTINVLMPYASHLIRLADWYRQLLAESIGKAKNNKGKKVNIGLTPINALGVTDQHSQSQLYNEGPNDKFFMFIENASFARHQLIKIPNLYPQDKHVSFLKNTSFNQLLKLEQQATAMSLTKNNRPNITIKIDKIDETSLGELFLFFEGAVAFLGEFYNINAFNQPGVELSKNLTKKLLLNS